MAGQAQDAAERRYRTFYGTVKGILFYKHVSFYLRDHCLFSHFSNNNIISSAKPEKFVLQKTASYDKDIPFTKFPYNNKAVRYT